MNKETKECAEFFYHVYGTILKAMNAPVGSNTNLSCDGKIYLTTNESDDFGDQSLQLNIPCRNYSKRFYYSRVANMTDRIINAIGDAV